MKRGVESLGRIKLQGLALLLVAFVAGVLAGAAGERVRASGEEPVPRRFPAGPPMFRPGELPPWFGELDLSDEQREEITAILEQRRPRTDSIMSEMLPRIRAVTDSIREEIRAVLTPEQARKLDEQEQRFRERRRGKGPRGRRLP